MALNATLTADGFTALPEALKEHYTLDGDAYRLQTDIVPENVEGLKSALTAEREARKEADKKLRETINRYKNIDPEKAQKAQEQLDAIEAKRLEDAGEFETLKNNFLADKENAVNTVKTELTTKLTKAEQKVQQVLITNALITEAAKQGVFPKSSELFATLAGNFVTLDDEYQPVISDNKGSSITELVSNLKAQDEFAVFFQADVATGSGSSPQSRSGGVQVDYAKMTPADKAAYIKDHGIEKFQQLFSPA